jgi:twitching motility protein PilT
MQVGKSVGMVSLNDALFELVNKKLVAPEEAHAKSVDKTGFEGLLKRIGVDLSKAAAHRPAPATA